MSKEKCEKVDKENCKHHYVVTGWMTRGGNQTATAMRCAHCLKNACLEQLDSLEFKEKNGIA
jgi:hypothetical protein